MAAHAVRAENDDDEVIPIPARETRRRRSGPDGSRDGARNRRSLFVSESPRYPDAAGNHVHSATWRSLETAMGNGDGTLAMPTTLGPPWHPQRVSAIDLDGNGRSD